MLNGNVLFIVITSLPPGIPSESQATFALAAFHPSSQTVPH